MAQEVGAEQALAAKSRSWACKDGEIICYPDTDNDCKVVGFGFAAAAQPTQFHDSELDEATKEINEILERIQRNNQDRERQLSAIDTPRGLFLAWTTPGAVSPSSDETEIEQILGLR